MNAPGYGLTARQRELLAYISERDLCPSYEEMRAALKLASASGVYGLIRQLEERGYIRRLPNRARAIEVIRTYAPTAEVVLMPPPGLPLPKIVHIPLYGRID